MSRWVWSLVVVASIVAAFALDRVVWPEVTPQDRSARDASATTRSIAFLN